MRKENTKFACIIFAMKIIDNAQKCILHFIHNVHMNRVHPKMIIVTNAITLKNVILHVIALFSIYEFLFHTNKSLVSIRLASKWKKI